MHVKSLNYMIHHSIIILSSSNNHMIIKPNASIGSSFFWIQFWEMVSVCRFLNLWYREHVVLHIFSLKDLRLQPFYLQSNKVKRLLQSWDPLSKGTQPEAGGIAGRCGPVRNNSETLKSLKVIEIKSILGRLTWDLIWGSLSGEYFLRFSGSYTVL